MVSGSIAQAPPSEPIGTRLIDSTPPAMTRSSQPEATFWAAMLTASRPEAQKRLSCTPATVLGRPALIAAVLAMSAPWSPTGETQPSTTSSTPLGSRLLVAHERLVHQADDEVDRLDGVQRSVDLALATGGPDRVEDECFAGGHGRLAPLCSSGGVSLPRVHPEAGGGSA